jgi:hypothetical protein
MYFANQGDLADLSGLSALNLLVYWQALHNVCRQSKLNHGSNSIATTPPLFHSNLGSFIS